MLSAILDLLSYCFEMHLPCKNNSCKEIKSICEEVESLSSFENNTSVNLNLAKEKLYRNECRKWQREVEVFPKLRFYNMFKDSYAAENFVVSIQNRK